MKTGVECDALLLGCERADERHQRVDLGLRQLLFVGRHLSLPLADDVLELLPLELLHVLGTEVLEAQVIAHRGLALAVGAMAYGALRLVDRRAVGFGSEYGRRQQDHHSEHEKHNGHFLHSFFSFDYMPPPVWQSAQFTVRRSPMSTGCWNSAVVFDSDRIV